ncbi:hypothetical protein [Streptomyces sp. NPDC012508]|uniref:hypothetical protein n=1 Tax=Streptomyces sp. NPDC012508 TaxID=3364837 RepID=UPI00368F2564
MRLRAAGHDVALATRGPPLRFQRVTAERLAAAITTATGDPALRTRSRLLAAHLAREDGAQPVPDSLERLA